MTEPIKVEKGTKQLSTKREQAIIPLLLHLDIPFIRTSVQDQPDIMVAVDTGSNVTWFQPHKDTVKTRKSLNALIKRNAKKEYDVIYCYGSVIVKDSNIPDVIIKTESSKNEIKLSSVIVKIAIENKTRYTGVFGFGTDSILPTAFFNAISSKGSIRKTLLLSLDFTNNTGKMIIGKTPKMFWVDLIYSAQKLEIMHCMRSSYWHFMSYVKIQNKNEKKQLMVDTMTSYIWVDKASYDLLTTHHSKIIFSITNSDNKIQRLSLDYTKYKHKLRCMQTIDVDNPTGIWVLGTPIFEEYDICFDYEHKKIGWRKKSVNDDVLSKFNPPITRGKPIIMHNTDMLLAQSHLEGEASLISSVTQ